MPRPSHTKPNATGRSSGNVAGSRNRSVMQPPKDEPWVFETRELKESPAWRHQSISCRRLIDFLQIDHMSHAGAENGNLRATYDQLVEYGVSRRLIKEAIQEAEFLGLIKVVKWGGKWNGTNQPTIFRLTLYHDRDFRDPTNGWKRRTEDEIVAWKETQAAARRDRKERQKAAAERRKKQVRRATS